jgi:hypothetical protein
LTQVLLFERLGLVVVVVLQQHLLIHLAVVAVRFHQLQQ